MSLESLKSCASYPSKEELVYAKKVKRLSFFFILLLLGIPFVFFYLSQAKMPAGKDMQPKKAIPTEISVTPTGPDLSYIEIIASKDTIIAVVDAKNQSVGSFSMQQGIRPPNVPTQGESAMKAIAQYVLEQPLDGVYRATVTTKESGVVTFYLYDRNADVIMQHFNQTIGTSEYTIDFSKISKSTVTKK